jgi:hypothetical protein
LGEIVRLLVEKLLGLAKAKAGAKKSKDPWLRLKRMKGRRLNLRETHVGPGLQVSGEEPTDRTDFAPTPR